MVSNGNLISLKQLKQYKFTRLKDITEAGPGPYNVIVVLKAVYSAKKCRDDYLKTIIVTDESLNGDKLSCNIFSKSCEQLDFIKEPGQVLILHRVKVDNFRNEFKLVGSHRFGFSFYIFPGEPSAPLEPLFYPGGNITEDDKKRVQELRVWFSDENCPVEKSDSDCQHLETLTLQEIQPQKHFNLIAKVIGRAVFDSYVLLRVLDGTQISSSFRSTMVAPIQDGVVELVPGLLGSILKSHAVDVYCYDDHKAAATNLILGDFVQFRNLHTFVQKSTSLIELALHAGFNFGRGITVLNNDDCRSKLISDRIMTIASFVEIKVENNDTTDSVVHDSSLIPSQVSSVPTFSSPIFTVHSQEPNTEDVNEFIHQACGKSQQKSQTFEMLTQSGEKNTQNTCMSELIYHMCGGQSQTSQAFKFVTGLSIQPVTDSDGVTEHEQSVQPVTESDGLTEQSFQPVTESDGVTEQSFQHVTESDGVTEQSVQLVSDLDSVTEQSVQPVTESDGVTGQSVQPVTDLDSVTEQSFQPVTDLDCVTKQSVQSVTLETLDALVLDRSLFSNPTSDSEPFFSPPLQSHFNRVTPVKHSTNVELYRVNGTCTESQETYKTCNDTSASKSNIFSDSSVGYSDQNTPEKTVLHVSGLDNPNPFYTMLRESTCRTILDPRQAALRFTSLTNIVKAIVEDMIPVWIFRTKATILSVHPNELNTSIVWVCSACNKYATTRDYAEMDINNASIYGCPECGTAGSLTLQYLMFVRLQDSLNPAIKVMALLSAEAATNFWVGFTPKEVLTKSLAAFTVRYLQEAVIGLELDLIIKGYYHEVLNLRPVFQISNTRLNVQVGHENGTKTSRKRQLSEMSK